MAKLGPVQEQTMEEILASIRRMISEGDAHITEPPVAEPRGGEPTRPAGNVAKLFADDDEDEPEPEPEPEAEEDVEAEEQATDNVVELAIAQAMEDAEAEVRADAAAAVTAPMVEDEPAPSSDTASPAGPASISAASPPAAIAREPARADDPRPVLSSERRTPAPLLSPRSDAVVSGAFNQLATTMLLSGSARTVDDLVEDLLRPMLRSWLDVNLPPLVERLVREEIERVARGRR
jgi:cell pole-organizing protein PopZ